MAPRTDRKVKKKQEKSDKKKRSFFKKKEKTGMKKLSLFAKNGIVRRKNQALESFACLILGLLGVALVSALIFQMIRFVPADTYVSICDRGNLLAILSISYQVIFLTTTLLSGLSDKSETIYWERFTEFVLVDPFLFNFRGLSGLAFLTLLTETIAFFGTGDIAIALFYGSFILGIINIILLSVIMTSIYFNRDHYLKRILKKEKDPGPDKVMKLMDMTIIAAGNHNSRIVRENLKLFSSLVRRESVKDYSVDVMLSLFDTLFEQNNYAEYLDLITNCIICATEYPELKASQDVVLWILKDPAHSEIWHDSVNKLDQESASRFYECLREYKKRVEDSLPAYVKMRQKNYMFEMDLEEYRQIDDVRKLINDYEINAVHVIDFMLDCRLLTELETVLSIFIDGIDPISIYPVPYPHIDHGRNRGFLLSVLKLIKNDGDKLSEFILSYSIVVYTLAYESINYDPDRDDIFTERLMNVFFENSDPDPNLKAVFHSYMLTVTNSRDVRKEYVHRIASDVKNDKDYVSIMINILSEDRWIAQSEFDLIDQDDDIKKIIDSYNSNYAEWKEIQEILKKDPESYLLIQNYIEDLLGLLKELCRMLE